MVYNSSVIFLFFVAFSSWHHNSCYESLVDFYLHLCFIFFILSRDSFAPCWETETAVLLTIEVNLISVCNGGWMLYARSFARSQFIFFTAIWQKYQFNNSLSVKFYDVCIAHVDIFLLANESRQTKSALYTASVEVLCFLFLFFCVVNKRPDEYEYICLAVCFMKRKIFFQEGRWKLFVICWQSIFVFFYMLG